MKSKILSGVKNLIRIGFLALAFAFPISWAGISVTGGALACIALQLASFGAFALAQSASSRLLGLAPHSCPANKTTGTKFVSLIVLSAFAQVGLAALLPFVALTAWWSIPLGGIALLVMAALSNFPTRVLDKIFHTEA